MDALKSAQTVIETEIAALQEIIKNLDDSFNDAVETLQSTLKQHGKIVVVGIGKSGNIGHKIAATLNSTGATAVVLNSQNALHGDLGLVSDGDTIIMLSQSGETTEILDLLPFLRRFKINLISLTGKTNSTLAQSSDHVLNTHVPKEACPLNLAPTSSSTAMLALGDALAMVLLEARGFSEEDFARFHPGGSLGRALLIQVHEIMRYGDALATVSLDSTVQDALSAMNAKRSGACLVISRDETLAGIFTHGDFARAFQETPDLGGQKVSDFMTVNPITLPANSLAAEAVATIGAQKIDDVVVVNDTGKPVGIVDSQDFARHKLI
ncbi:KpsF/GutQ family sugar-phosphate isomerase [Akkermansiaceae bacterium]|nr:KpsF/GutQ family sugar-phosphate isomerase [Akkermansiaceae bacterium]MDB4541590.1 KpsF/GutQ family sugar-phosphate isomerase [Akkermansiaceae bacterium]